MINRKEKKRWRVYARYIAGDGREYSVLSIIHAHDICGAWMQFRRKRPGATYYELRITEVEQDERSEGIFGENQMV